jgi:adenylate cyclase
VLFADLRGYTRTTELLDLPNVARMLGSFYERCAPEIWNRDGIINKLLGDAILAVYNFPITRPDHARAAVESAAALQERCRSLQATLPVEERERAGFGVGVGIHTGEVSVGELGEFCRDFTVIGGVVNLASRLQSAARAGEVLVTEEVYQSVRDLYPQAKAREFALKGIQKPVLAYSVVGP